MNIIKKTIPEDSNVFKEFLDKLELTYFDNAHSEDEEVRNKHEKMFQDLVEEKKAYELCREVVNEEYITEIFTDVEIMGYVAKLNGEYVGFILFKKAVGGENELYLSLVGTKPKIGMPLGQILISIMEEVANESDMHTIIADSVEGAIEFYKKNGWDILEKDNEDNSYLIEKQIREKRPEEIEKENKEDELLFEELKNFDFEKYANDEVFRQKIDNFDDDSSSESFSDSEDEESEESGEFDVYEDVNLFNRVFGYACSYFEK